MKMDDEKLKRILKEGMEYEADCIMAEVNSDPNVQDVIAPEDLHTNLMEQIKEHEAEVERDRQNQAKEDQELIRLGKIYKKKRARRKYIILIAAVVCALAVGTISFGDGKKVFTEIKGLFGNPSHTRISEEGSEKFDGDTVASEEDAYEQIEEKFGFYPVRMVYLPEGIDFEESNIDEDMQGANIYYADESGKSISYRIVTKHRNGSVSSDVEDVLVRQYEKNIEGTTISISEYKIEENNSQRWMVKFVYGDAQYSLLLMGIQEEEVEKIIENLYFS